MRILRLDLERYGHIGGQHLDFPPDKGLHVVLGANEAGKSTALEALADGLFGFGRDSRKLAHPEDPRIALTLRAADGTQARFTRHRTGKDKLRDAAGAPLPELALARFLGGATRTRFREVFGLDGERLRQGGRTILQEHGEAGAAILQAQTGLSGLRATVDRLDEDAKKLFGDGRGARRISLGATAVKENRKLIAERSLSGADYARAAAEAATLDASLESIQHETRDLHAEQARLQRTRRVAPIRRALAAAAARQTELGPPPDLPHAAAETHAAALARRDQARRDHARDQARLAALAAQGADLAPDPAILLETDAITARAADLSLIAVARRDLLKESGQAAERRNVLDAIAARLAVPERGPALRPRLAAVAAARRTAERLLNDQRDRQGKRTAAHDAALRADRDATAAEALAALPRPPDADPIRDAIAAADREGDIDRTLADAHDKSRAAASDAAAALAALPLWTGDAARLRAAPPPLEAEALRLGAAMDSAATRLDEADRVLLAHDAALATCQAAMAGMAQAGTVPTADAVAALRARRDETWSRLRRHYEGGAAPPEPRGDLATCLDRLIHEADALADRRGAEAVRVAEWDALRTEAGRLQATTPTLLSARDAAREARDAAHAAWSAAWVPAGVQPGAPAAMREWVRARDAALRAARAADEARHAHHALAARHDAAATSLRALLPDHQGDLACLRRAAARTLKSRDAALAAHDKATALAATTRATHADARRRLQDIDDATAAWRQEWTPVAARLGLTAAATLDEAAEALTAWTEAQTQLDLWAENQGHITEMQDAIAAHDAAMAALATRLATPVSDADIPALAARLAAARQTETDAARLAAEQKDLQAALAAHDRDAAEAAATLDALRARIAAPDDEALAEALARAAEHATLAATIRGRETELHAQDDGKAPAELDHEATLLDADAIPGRLAEIAARLLQLGQDSTAATVRRTERAADIKRMETGQDVAGPAQDVQDALAGIEDDAQRYIRLRLAHALLRAGIDRFRRSQQGPLLAGASTLFAELTANRYARLEQDENDKREPILVAIRPDGTTCPADMLSEGTRDQLFLALRLASIALEAGAAEPLPFIADDLLVNFDDDRAAAALRLLARFGQQSQVILFTHHPHLLDLLPPGAASIHHLPA